MHSSCSYENSLFSWKYKGENGSFLYQAPHSKRYVDIQELVADIQDLQAKLLAFVLVQEGLGLIDYIEDFLWDIVLECVFLIGFRHLGLLHLNDLHELLGVCLENRLREEHSNC